MYFLDKNREGMPMIAFERYSKFILQLPWALKDFFISSTDKKNHLNFEKTDVFSFPSEPNIPKSNRTVKSLKSHGNNASLALTLRKLT